MERIPELPKTRGQEEEKQFLNSPELQERLSEGIETVLIKELVLEMAELANKTKEKALEYDSIISDDASGRLVSLFLKRVFDVSRKKAKLPLLNLRFIAGGRHMILETEENIKKYLEKNKEKLGRVLLVTEYVERGESLKNLISLFGLLGIDFDIAALTVREDGLKNLQSVQWGGKLYYGDLSTRGLRAHGRIAESGVFRKGVSPFPHRSFEREGREEDRIRVKRETAQARKDIKLLAKKVLKLLEK